MWDMNEVTKIEYRIFFSRVTVEGGVITWPNGADVAPEALYEKLLPACEPNQASK
jgi:hypothetical protein